MQRFVIAPATGVAGRGRTTRGHVLLGLLIVVASLSGWSVTGIASASAAADLAIATAAAGDFVVGEDSVLVLTVTNVGTSTSSGTATVTNTLPASLTYGSVSASGWTCTGSSTMTCATATPVASGGSLPEIVLHVVPTAAAVPVAANRASLSITGDPNPANNISDFPATVAYAADMSIGLGHSGGPLKTGGQETINIRVHNEGYYRVDAATTVSSAVPPGLQVLAVTGGTTWTCTAAQTFACTTGSDGGSLGNYTNIRLVVKATDAGYPATPVTATVTSAGDQNPANNAGTDTIQVQAARDAAAELVSLPLMTVGTEAQLAFRARNVGTASSAVMAFTFALPPQLRFVGLASAGWTCIPGPVVTSCADPKQIANLNLLRIRVKPLRPLTGGPMTVTVTTPGEQNPVNNTFVAAVSINPYIPQRYTMTGGSGQRRTALLKVGDKLTVSIPQPRRGAKWRMRTASTAVSRPYVTRSSGRIHMRFTARRGGRATLRFTRKAGRKTRRFTLVVTVVDPGA